MSDANSPEDETTGDSAQESGGNASAGASGAPAESETPPVDPLEAARAEAQKSREQLLRVAADFDNYKKRSRREMEDAIKVARGELLRDLLPVFDNLERASVHAGKATDTKSLADGISMVQRQFLDTLGKLGIERVPAVGQAFDPAVHEAVQHLETDEYSPGVVAAELQAGYRMADRVLRPSMVVVAKAKPS